MVGMAESWVLSLSLNAAPSGVMGVIGVIGVIEIGVIGVTGLRSPSIPLVLATGASMPSGFLVVHLSLIPRSSSLFVLLGFECNREHRLLLLPPDRFLQHCFV